MQIFLVAGIELSNDVIRGFFAPRPPDPAQANAVRVMLFEQRLGLWLEPAIQRYFEHTPQLFGFPLGWDRVMPLANAVYGLAPGLITGLFAFWLFRQRRTLFPFICNIFLFATALSVLIYNVFPVAPPRLATGLRYQGHPFRFVDTVFAGGGVSLSFDKLAAMPSLHVVWAVIVGGSVAALARPIGIRLVAIGYPFLVGWSVVVTGNHYFADALGGLGVVVIAYCLALLVSSLRDHIALGCGGREQRAFRRPDRRMVRAR